MSRQQLRRDQWPWLAVIPLGLGSWAPIIAAARCRVWWWALPGLASATCVMIGFAHSSAAHQPGVADPAHQRALAAAFLIAGWMGGIVSSFALRPAYERHVGYPTPETLWPQATERSRQWTVRYALVAYAGSFLAAVLTGLLLRHGLGVHLGIGPDVLVTDLMLLLALVPLWRRHRIGIADIGLRRTPGVRSLGLAVLGLMVYGLVALVWLAIVQPHSSSGAARTLSGTSRLSDFQVVLAVLAIAVSAPVVEEIFFRGLLYRSLRNRMPILPAALLAGALFGLVHIVGYPLESLPVKGAFGVIACLLYERTGSLLPGIALHCFVDASVIDAALTGNDLIVLGASAAAVIAVFVGGAITRGRSGGAPAR